MSVGPVDADLTRAVRTVIDRCLAVEPGERVLVIADPDTVDVGRALLDALTPDAALVIAPPDPARGTEPSALVAAALAAPSPSCSPRRAMRASRAHSAPTSTSSSARERRSPTTATFALAARSGTSRAVRRSSPRPGERAASWSVRSPPSASRTNRSSCALMTAA